MPRKIESPLYTGLPAKLYFHCYIKPQTGYSLAKVIYGFPKTEKIYKSLDRFKKYFEKTEAGYKSNSKYLVEAIKQRLDRDAIQLTKKEEEIFCGLINSDEFKQYVLSYATHQGKKSYKITDDPDFADEFPNEFNAFLMITEPIGIVCTSAYINLEFKKQPIKIDEKKYEQVYKSSYPNNWRTYFEGVEQHNKLVPYLKKFSNESLLKLSKLWYAGKTIILSEIVESYNKTEIICPKCGHKIKRRKTR